MIAKRLVRELLDYIEEWKYEESPSGANINFCTECGAAFGSGEVLQHKPDCKLRALIEEAEEWLESQ